MTVDDDRPNAGNEDRLPPWLVSACFLIVFAVLAYYAATTEPIPPTPPGAGTPAVELYGDPVEHPE